jgi:hypothetical protein
MNKNIFIVFSFLMLFFAGYSNITTIDLMAPLIRIKNVTIDESYFMKRTLQKNEIDSSFLKALIHENIVNQELLKADVSTKIKVIDTLLNTRDNKVFIVSRESEHESWAWVIQVNGVGKILFWKEVYYADIVEYFLTVVTKIKNNQIVIIRRNNIDDDKSTAILKYIFKNGKITKLGNKKKL